jgi:hypothetical protein
MIKIFLTIGFWFDKEKGSKVTRKNIKNAIAGRGQI